MVNVSILVIVANKRKNGLKNTKITNNLTTIIMETKTNYAAYLRVSTQRQGASNLGLEAQEKMCKEFAMRNGGCIAKVFKDIESGKSRTRQGLWDAIDYCKANNCPLVIAKLDRLARDIEFTFKVINTGIDIHFCDMPVVNSMILGVFAAVAQYERELISGRTKSALDAKRARGEETGGTSKLWGKKTGANRDDALHVVREQSAKARRERMKKEPANVFFWNYIVSQRENGREFENVKDFERLSNELNRLNQSTPKGLPYNACRAWAVYRKLEKVYC